MRVQHHENRKEKRSTRNVSLILGRIEFEKIRLLTKMQEVMYRVVFYIYSHLLERAAKLSDDLQN